MREALTPRPTELTRPQASPRLRGGDIFMAEPITTVEKPTVKISPAWQEELGKDVSNPDTRSTARLASEMGIEPGSQEVRKQNFKEVQKEDADRIEKARGLLKKETLTPQEEKAISEAHYYGIATNLKTGKQYVALEGKDGKRTAGIGNYKREDLGVKVDILRGEDIKNLVIDKKGRRILMENEVVGSKANLGDLDTFDPASFTDPIIRGNADDFGRRVTRGEADVEFLREFAADIRRLKNESGTTPERIAQADQLIDEVERVRNIVLERDLHGQEESNRRQEERRGRGRGASSPEMATITEDVNRYLEERAGRPDPQKRTEADKANERTLISRIKERLLDPRTPPVDTRSFPDDLLEAAASFQETREMLISQIIFKSFEDSTERNEFDIDWNARENLKRLLEAARLNSKDHTEYQDLLGLETSARLFHTMNGRLLAGTLEEFTRIAERIDPKNYRLMNELVGVGQVMRLYEQKYAEALAKHGTIYDYDAVKKEVEDSFKKMTKAGFVKTKYDTRTDENGTSSNRLADWEVERALNIGRNFANITFRAGEYIALGEPSKLAANIRFGSGPQESVVKLLNHLQWVADRFSIGDARGGAEFYELVKKRFHENNQQDQISGNRKKIGFNKIKKFGGRTVDEMELAEFFGIKSFYSSWRLQNMSFPRIKFTLQDRETNLKEWFDAHHEKIDHIREEVKPNDHLHYHGNVDIAKEHLLHEFKPLIEHLDNGLGVLLANSAVAGEPGYLVRKMIWEKVAKTNTPMMINYLEGLIMKHPIEKEIAKKIKDQHMTKEQSEKFAWEERNRIYPPDFARSLQILQKETGIAGDAFKTFKAKVLLEQQRRVLKAAGENVDDITLDPLTPQEQALQDRITEEGLKLAPHLADVLFAYTPFMNDVQFEQFDYEKPGQEAYKRLIGDYGQYSGAQHGYDALQDHIAGSAKIDDLIGAIKKMESGMSGPPGPREGMTRSVPVVEAVVDFYEAGRYTGDIDDHDPNKKEKQMENLKKEPNRFKKQLFYRLIRETMEKPNSLSQKFGSTLTENMDEGAARTFLEKMNKVGVISHAQMERIRKKKKLSFGWLWVAIFRDIFPLILLAGVREFIDESAEGVPGMGKGRGGGDHH